MKNSVQIKNRFCSRRCGPRQGAARVVLSLACGLLVAAAASAADSTGEPTNKLPDFGQVQQVAARHFASLSRGPQDLISQGDVQPIFAQLAKLGWKVADQEKISKQILADGDFLVGELRSKSGQQFVRKTAGQGLLYDRLDRIAQVYGGKQMIRDLQKLPDPQNYTKPKTAAGYPDLLELLPKQGTGKVRTIKDYTKPTGRIYTAPQFMQQLQQSYAAAKNAAP